MIRKLLLSLLIGLVGIGSAGAETLDGCTDSGMFSKARFFTDLCWTCMFPMRVAGVTIPMSPKRTAARAPVNATTTPVCFCPGRTGYPSPGITWGMWQPSHMIELTRQPFCSPILFGKSLLNTGTVGGGISGAVLKGTPGQLDQRTNQARGSFYNFHWMTFPVGELMDMLTNNLCSKKSADMDYLYFTEFDPTWTSEMLALYTHPEIKLFTKIYAHAACVADAVAATTYQPLSEAFWCAGTWGMLYPFAGKGGKSNKPETQMLAAARGVAAMHRRGLAKLQYTYAGMCADMFYFVMPKLQYQFQNMWPWPERNQAQWIGTSSWVWGQWRNAPAAFEDRVVTQWTYRECCITFW